MEERCVNSPGPGPSRYTPWLPLSFTRYSHGAQRSGRGKPDGRVRLPGEGGGPGGGERNVASGCRVASREDERLVSTAPPVTS